MANPLVLVDDDGYERHLGNIVPEGPPKYRWPIYGDVDRTPMFARPEWPKLIAAMTAVGLSYPYLSPVHDQNGYGMCNASATASALQGARLKQGLPLVHLSAGDLYGRINGGRDQGSMLEDSLAESMRVGIASVDVVPYLDWQGRHPGAAESRRKYRVLEAFLCPEFDHCMSAVIAGFDLISGIMWHSNYKPDSDGWLPSRRSGQGGGHAVHGFAPAHRNGAFGIWHKNSWRPSWGLQGLCVFPEPAYEGPVGGWWAVRSVVDEGGESPAPKFLGN